MRVIVRLIGCDDENIFPMTLDSDAVALLELVSEKSINTSTNSCMPIMRVVISDVN